MVAVSLKKIFFFQAEDGIRDLLSSRGLGDVYKRQGWGCSCSRACLRACLRACMRACVRARVCVCVEEKEGWMSFSTYCVSPSESSYISNQVATVDSMSVGGGKGNNPYRHTMTVFHRR